MTEQQLSSFGKWLQGELDRRKMLPADLARDTGVYRSTVRKWLYEGRPTLHSLERIAETLSLPLDEVLAAAGYGKPEPEDTPAERLRRRIAGQLHLVPEAALPVVAAMIEGLTGRQTVVEEIADLLDKE